MDKSLVTEKKVIRKELIRNLERYAKEEKIKQQKSKILGQKQVKGTTNKGEKTNV